MQIEITYEKEDWQKYIGYISSSIPKSIKSPLDKGWVNLLIWLYISFFLLIVFQNAESIHRPTAVIGAVFILSLYIIFRPNKKKLIQAYAPSENGVFLGRHIYNLTEEGIGHNTKGYEGFHSWINILNIKRANGLIMLFVDTDSAFVFPEEKLEDPESFYNYAVKCNQKVQRA